MKQIIFLCMPLLSFIYSGEESSMHDDPIINLRFEFGVRCQKVAEQCKTNNKDCKFAVTQLKKWLTVQPLDDNEKKLLLHCLEQSVPENS